MVNARIAGIASYLPEDIIDNEMLSMMVDTTDEWITTRVGIKERRILKKEGAGSFYVAARHFLGGKEPAEYAQMLFDSWALTENDALLLMVIGEERYALVLGKELQKNFPDESRTLLLSAFRTAFLSRDYDRAVGDLALNLAPIMASGKNLSLSGLFGREIQLTPAPQTREQIQKTVTGLWREMFGEIQSEQEEWKEQQKQEEVQSNWKTILIWGLVIYFLFFRKKKRKKKRRR